TTSWVYGPGGLPLEQIGPNNTVLFFHHDQLGSTRLLTDAHGAVAGAFNYDTYGRPIGTGIGVTTPFGFGGQYTDAETGFQYLRARYYDPATASFLSRDPAAAGTRSPYGYTHNDPTNEVD